MEPERSQIYSRISPIKNTFSVLFVFGVKFVFAYFDGGFVATFPVPVWQPRVGH